jgi:hypothetical protein
VNREDEGRMRPLCSCAVFGDEPEAGTPLGPVPQRLDPPGDRQEEKVEGCTVIHRYIDNEGAKIHLVECGNKEGHLVRVPSPLETLLLGL